MKKPVDFESYGYKPPLGEITLIQDGDNDTWYVAISMGTTSKRTALKNWQKGDWEKLILEPKKKGKKK